MCMFLSVVQFAASPLGCAGLCVPCLRHLDKQTSRASERMGDDGWVMQTSPILWHTRSHTERHSRTQFNGKARQNAPIDNYYVNASHMHICVRRRQSTSHFAACSSLQWLTNMRKLALYICTMRAKTREQTHTQAHTHTYAIRTYAPRLLTYLCAIAHIIFLIHNLAVTIRFPPSGYYWLIDKMRLLRVCVCRLAVQIRRPLRFYFRVCWSTTYKTWPISFYGGDHFAATKVWNALHMRFRKTACIYTNYTRKIDYNPFGAHRDRCESHREVGQSRSDYFGVWPLPI